MRIANRQQNMESQLAGNQLSGRPFDPEIGVARLTLFSSPWYSNESAQLRNSSQVADVENAAMHHYF